MLVNLLKGGAEATIIIQEVNPVPLSINNADLEEKVSESLCLTGSKGKPDDLDTYHRMKKNDQVIIKFKNRKQKNGVIFKRKELTTKGDGLQIGRPVY